MPPDLLFIHLQWNQLSVQLLIATSCWIPSAGDKRKSISHCFPFSQTVTKIHCLFKSSETDSLAHVSTSWSGISFCLNVNNFKSRDYTRSLQCHEGEFLHQDMASSYFCAWQAERRNFSIRHNCTQSQKWTPTHRNSLLKMRTRVVDTSGSFGKTWKNDLRIREEFWVFEQSGRCCLIYYRRQPLNRMTAENIWRLVKKQCITLSVLLPMAN